ncbi:MAG TPA: carboxymuconolactone decarboxylase family protein [Syntrophorhabdaceae bacterium]|nr:carboxymuconolactone decarboxylase family protein [Syntrophorhabdaceae bacterium]
MSKTLPKHYQSIRDRFVEYGEALDKLDEAVRGSGPLDKKTAHLIQLAASAAIRSEGGVHSHARRALEQGASINEIQHALILLTGTIGFPNVAAAISWVDALSEK